MESNHRFLCVRQVSSPLDHRTRFSVGERGRREVWERPALTLSPHLPLSLSPSWKGTPPKDLNPDLLGWNQQCYRYTKDA